MLLIEKRFEDTEGAIKNGQDRKNDNIEFTRHRTNSSKTKSTTYKTKKDEQHGPQRKQGVNSDAREWQAVPMEWALLQATGSKDEILENHKMQGVSVF